MDESRTRYGRAKTKIQEFGDPVTTLYVKTRNGSAFRDPAFMANRDVPIHRWVPWIAGYSKHFVEDALMRYTSGPSVVLDPFAGVGTTLVEADLAGHEAVGFEIKSLRRICGASEVEGPPARPGLPPKHC